MKLLTPKDRTMSMKTVLYALAALLFLSLPTANAEAAEKKQAEASFAMGCFWCAEHAFEKIDGVIDVVSGYEGGSKETATYEQVSKGNTGHIEAVRVTYNPEKVSYEKLLEVFWDNVDPFDAEGQFCDKGSQYAAVIFTATAEEEKAARKSLKDLQARHPDRIVAVKIRDASPFYPAEAHHQDFAKNNKNKYEMYSFGCGRERKLKKIREGN